MLLASESNGLDEHRDIIPLFKHNKLCPAAKDSNLYHSSQKPDAQSIELATAFTSQYSIFIDDAMLIVFPIGGKVTKKAACLAALESARDAQQTLAALNHRRRRHSQPEIKFGVGLNVGEVIYGNVGAPDRLDFTVMGPAVNRTARLESLTKTIGESILFSETFAEQIDCPTKYYGEHLMKGISQPQKVFAADESCE